MGKSAPSPPAAPDPNAIAGAQGAANVDTAKAQAALNNVNQITPYGSSTFTSAPSSSNPSVPQYTQTISLNPAEQSTLTQQQQLANTLAGYGGEIAANSGAAITKPLDFSGLPTDPTSLDMAGAQPAIKAAYESQYGLIQPGLQQAQKTLESQMDNAGIPRDSAAWKTAETNLSADQAMQTNALANQSYGAGENVASTNAQLQAAARAQGITEQQLLQTQPINELAALLQGAPAISSPNVMSPAQTGVSPTDVTGAYGVSQAARNTAYQGGINAASSGNSAAAGLLGAGATAAAIF